MSIVSSLKFVLAALAAVTALLLLMPLNPRMPAAGLDESWMYAINEATARGMSFGKDVIFTFGPYGGIYTKMFHPQIDTMMMGAGLFLGLSFALVTGLLIRSASIWWGIVFVYLFAGHFFSKDVLFAAYGLLVAIVVSNYLDKNNSARFEGLLLIALTFAFGLLPLIKGSFLVNVLASSFAIFCFFASARRPLLAVSSVIAPVLSMLIFWSIAGQPMASIVPYFSTMIQILSGYTEAMTTYGDPREIVLFLAAAAAILWMVINLEKSIWFRFSLLTAFGTFLFVAFKGGFVRHDSHAFFAAAAVIIAAVCFNMCTSNRVRTSPLVWLAVIAWFSIDYAYMRSFREFFFAGLARAYDTASEGLDRRRNYEGLKKEFSSARAIIFEDVKIPRVEGRTDIYNYGQAYLLVSGNDWRPRPIFQSYAAYTPELARLNRDHLVGAQAPENIFFKVEAIDGRFPSIDDGSSWPVLLARYTPLNLQDDYLSLKRRDIPQNPESKDFAPLPAVLGQRVNVPSDDLIYARIRIERTILGKLAALVFKIDPLEMTVELANGQTRDFRIVSGMMDSGFIASPLVDNTQDFASLFEEDSEDLKSKAVRSLTINGTSLFWRSSYRVEFTGLKFAASEAVTLADQSAQGPPAGLAVEAVDVCEGSIDRLNGVAVSSTNIKSGNSVSLDGWMTISGKDGTTPDNVYVTLATKNGQTVFVKTRRTARPDLNMHFKQPKLRNAGFIGRANLSGLEGDVMLGLAREANGRLEVCKNFKLSLYRGGEPEPEVSAKPAKPMPYLYDPIEEGLTPTNEVMEDTCEGNFDSINGAPPNDSQNKVNSELQIQGWTTIAGKEGTVPDAVLIRLEDAQGKKSFVRAKAAPRDDLKAFFTQPRLPDAGFKANIDVSKLKGGYTVGLSRLYKGEILSCARLSFPIEVGQ